VAGWRVWSSKDAKTRIATRSRPAPPGGTQTLMEDSWERLIAALAAESQNVALASYGMTP